MFKKFSLSLAAFLLVWGSLAGMARAGNAAAELAFERGLSAYEESQWGEALSYFDQAIAADSNYAIAHHYRGTTLLQLNQPEEAIKALEKSRDLDPNAPDIYLDLGSAYQKAGRSDDALAAFKEEVRRRPDSAQAQFSLGYALILRKEYQAAMAPLAKSRELDSSLAAPARFYEGSALFAMNKRDNAKVAFKEVLGMNPPPELANACRKYIAAIEGGGGAKRWGLIGTVLYQYDTNVVAASSGTEFPTTIEDNQISRKEDSRGVITLYTRWQFLKADPWSAEARYSFYQSFHGELSMFNLQNHTPELIGGRTFSMGGRESGITLDYRASIALLGEKLPMYSVSHTVTPSFAIKWSPKFSTAFSYRFISEDFESTQPDRDNTTHGGYIDFFWKFWGDRATLKETVGYDFSDAKDNDYDITRPWESLSLDLNLPWKVRTRLSLRYQNDNHHNSLSSRVDDIFTTELLVFRPIWGPIEANLNVNYRLNNSSDEIFEYERTIVGGGVVVRF